MSIQPLEGSLGTTPLSPFAGIGDGTGPLAQESISGAPSGDAISRMVPPWLSNSLNNPAQTALFGPLAGLLQQLMQMLSQLTGGATSGSGGACTPWNPQTNCPPGGNGNGNGNEQYFANASGSSEGDPHLSFNGNRWNSMVSHPNLLDSNTISGGYRLSTQVTTPNERGVTRNQSATVALNNGATTISMNKDGQPTIDSYGRNVSIARGQTVALGDGATASYGANGKLTVVARNDTGGEITTSLQGTGEGVNVDVNAHDVDLGGALVRGERMHPGPIPNPGPIPTPIPGPNPGPFPQPVPAGVTDPFSIPIMQPFGTTGAPPPNASSNPYPDQLQIYDDASQ